MLAPAITSAQVVFNELPGDLQLLPREDDNYGRFTIRGTCTYSGSGILQLQVLNAADSLVIETVLKKLVYQEQFELPVKLKAQLTEYDLKIWFYDRTGKGNQVAYIRHLVAGDVFLVGGQSNAHAGVYEVGSARELDNLYGCRFCRTIGQEFSTALALKLKMKDDAKFRRPSSGFPADASYGFVGVWALKLQHDLAEKSGIPICLINSSQGATTIAHHLALNIPTSGQDILNSADSSLGPLTMYERLYMKTYLNRLTGAVKGIVWYQGESDGDATDSVALNYKNSFSLLYNSWKADYPGLKRIFVFQINTGCGGNYLPVVREQQMQLGDDYPDVTVMTTVGGTPEGRSNDGCHFRPQGYLRIADNMSPAILKYIYGHELREADILPPRLIAAGYSSVSEICLRFDKKVMMQDSAIYYGDSTKVAFLRDYFYDDKNDQLLVKNIRSSDDCVFLDVGQIQKRIGTISYLPGIFCNIPAIYDGPWILNANNKQIGAFPIYNFPVSKGEFKEDIYVYPNPASDKFTVRSVVGNYITGVLMHDISGRKIYDSGQVKTDVLTVLTEMPEGLYTVSVTHAGFTSVFKMIVKGGISSR